VPSALKESYSRKNVKNNPQKIKLKKSKNYIKKKRYISIKR